MKFPYTPQEQFEYKQKWKPTGHTVIVHSDLIVKCKEWCRRNCQRWEWSMDLYTDVYAHTFFFEHENAAEEFKEHFKEWIQ